MINHRVRWMCAAALLALGVQAAVAQNQQETKQAEHVVVGRAKVVLPALGVWREVAADDGAITYSGSSQGKVPGRYRVWVLVTAENRVSAIVGVRASENFGLSDGYMSWANNCKPHAQFYVVDGTKGSVDGMDCLKVWGRVATSQVMQSWLSGAAAKLSAMDVVSPSQVLGMHHVIGNDQGQFIETIVLTAVNFAGIDDIAPKGTLNNIQPRTARWADLMAEAARKSLFSLSGRYIFPDMTFAE